MRAIQKITPCLWLDDQALEVAEFYTALSGLGNQIATSANLFQTARMFVPVTLVTLLGVGLTALLEWIEHRLARWRKAAS